ncbi:uncharacterized protein LOC125496676 [Beta vulgaris subsp. vulgaris]|uniref:uncharacterized protein LOC125496676 n=1 Tax=Beta vulgaris subsp. vulgaris TaxID=3555 RepID=UPI002037529D|nr:uncharacterized protein LOC125496676 [Beta vulgaris subsp. vulgaris]
MDPYMATLRGLRQGDPISPLLFVICMEYLSRLIRSMEDHPLFKFHPRCKKSKLTPMVFADDIILCCEGSFPSVYTMLKAFKLFSATSGLQISEQKSDFYTAGVSQEVIQRIKAATNFAHNKLFFRYLGLPVCARKIRVAECNGIIEKMCARIKVWSSRNLSYMARVTLVNSVLLSIHQYWAQMFILPKSVLKEIEKICRAFLWTGEWNSSKPGNVAWEHVCLPKQAKGVGFRQIQTWYVAEIAKYVWAISTKQNNLWVKLVHEVYVKDARWWDYEPPIDSCWYWKQICKVKSKLKLLYSEQEWNSLTKFSVQQVYKKLIGEQPAVHWDKLIWNRLVIPKHRVIGWLVMKQRLRTLDILVKIGVQALHSCHLCEQGIENHNHLFIQCKYSTQCLDLVRGWMGMKNQHSIFPRQMLFIMKSKRTGVKKRFMAAVFSGLVYQIWWVRNEAIWNHVVSKPEFIFRKLKQLIQQRIRLVLPHKITARDQLWIDSMLAAV